MDFTTETLLNNLARVSVLTNAEDKAIPVGDKALEIKRLNTYLASQTGKVYRALGNNPVKEVATITVPAGLTPGTYRLELDLTTSGSYPITFDRWAINKGKPIYVEFNLPVGTAATAAAFVTAATPWLQKGLLKNNGESIKDVVVTGAGATIVITAANEYIRVKGAKITKLSATGESFDEVGTTVATTTAGKEGFGSTWYILKNLRIPTQEATRFMGEDQDERPIEGTLYNQYTFEYTADRNFHGNTAVGQKLTSVTTHVLFVPQSLATAFEAQITSALGTGSILDNVTKAIVNAA